MQWSSEQIHRYNESPEYFDTAIIPCYRISLDHEIMNEQNVIEEQMARVLEVEGRLKGRIVLFPALVIYGSNDQHIKPMIESTLRALHMFKYRIFIPFDETLTIELQQSLENTKGTLLSARNDLFSEIVSIWNQK